MKYLVLLLGLLLCSCAITGIGNPGITFYGVVVDEAGQPLPEAEIYLDVMTSILQVDDSSGNEYRMKTDKDGRFHFSKSGLSIQIEVIKPGYLGTCLDRDALVINQEEIKKGKPATTVDSPYIFRLHRKKAS
jgi:hypothetical protein